MLVGSEAEAEPEFRVVLEQRVRPSRAAAFMILAPGRHGKVAAVDRRTAGCVRDHHPVTEQLRQKFEVRRLTTAGTGAGEFEQRLEELHAAYVGEINPSTIVHRQTLE